MLRDAAGNEQTIRTTDEHPFYVEGYGWLRADELAVGLTLSELDGSGDSVILASTREAHPEGVTVYNLEVGTDHTYFVADESGNAVWVHNKYIDIAGFVRLNKTQYGLARKAHKAEAITRLQKMVLTNPAFASNVEAIGGKKVLNSLAKGIRPRGWVVHHLTKAQASGQAGWLALVRESRHKSFSKLLHPNRYGGFKEWSIPFADL